MQIPLQHVDLQYVSCPFVFKASAPPYMAASLENIPLYPARITVATQQLKLKYEMVLLETSGGIMTLDRVFTDHRLYSGSRTSSGTGDFSDFRGH